MAPPSRIDPTNQETTVKVFLVVLVLSGRLSGTVTLKRVDRANKWVCFVGWGLILALIVIIPVGWG